MSLTVVKTNNLIMASVDVNLDLKISKVDVLLFVEIMKTGMERDALVLMDMLDIWIAENANIVLLILEPSMKSVSVKLDLNGINTNGLALLFAIRPKFGMARSVSVKMI